MTDDVTKNPKQTVERIHISKDKFKDIEDNIRFHEHLRRYASVRRYVYGKVIDFACGCGYGSYLLSVNPEVTKVVGIDIDDYATDWANSEYKNEKTEFRCCEISEVNEPLDTLVCLETIEHLKDLSILLDLVKRCDIKNLIISFPDKKSTHFNPFHFHDFTRQDVIDLFPSHAAYYDFKSGDVQFINFIKLPENAPSHIFRNIRDF